MTLAIKTFDKPLIHYTISVFKSTCQGVSKAFSLSKDFVDSYQIYYFAQSAGAVEYTNCTSAVG